MFARFEVGMRPEFSDPAVHAVLRKVEMARPELRRKIRWGRLLDVYWVDLPCSREDLIRAATEVFWDKVLQWMFTGNLIPSAAGKNGGLLDLMEVAPHRPGSFWAIERRFRAGVTDNVARTAAEAFEIVLGELKPAAIAGDSSGPAPGPAPGDARFASGTLLLLEGQGLDEEALATIARDIFCNELIETWTIIPESELKNNNRFHQERIKRDLPRPQLRAPGPGSFSASAVAPGAVSGVTGAAPVETLDLASLAEEELDSLSQKRLWALSRAEMLAIRDYFSRSDVMERRKAEGLEGPTDVELEVLAQTWSEHCKHKIFGARVTYRGNGDAPIPENIDGLFKTTIAATTREIQRPWLLSVFSDNAGIVAFDEENAFCIKVETHNSPSALDPYGGALTGIVGVNRDILGCGLGARPIFNTDVFCVAPLDYSRKLPDRILHPRRILDGIRHGVEDGGNKSGIPTVNGALVFDERYLGKPLVYCGTGGFFPRVIAGRPCESKEVLAGDRICMVGGRIGKDGIHGATFSSLAFDESSPVSAVQLGDPITQKRAADFLLEARDLGLYRGITDNGAGGLSSSVGEMARISGGARMDVGAARVKYPGLRPYELVVSESQERMTVAVPADRMRPFLELAARRGVEVSDLGEFTASGRFEIHHHERLVASLDLEFLHEGVPRLELEASWSGRPEAVNSGRDGGSGVQRESFRSFESKGMTTLLEMMGRPGIASKEWLIRQYDHEVQGSSVIKPLHTVAPGTPEASSGPNDAAVLRPGLAGEGGLVIGCGICPRLSDIDPLLMAQAAVDEAIRNVLCVGAEYGRPESVITLCDNFCWPDPVGDPAKMGALVRACYGLRDACLALEVPLVSGKDSMKNDFRGKLDGKPVLLSVPPTLLMTAVARISDVRAARTSDFKRAGEVIYLLGGGGLGLQGSEFELAFPAQAAGGRVGEPDWAMARRIYSWIGGATGREQGRLRALHDISEGGLLVAVAECLIARGLGAHLSFPVDLDPWEFGFGEGFHSFVASASDADASGLEAEWESLDVPFRRLGGTNAGDRLEITVPDPEATEGAPLSRWSVSARQLRLVWQKGGYWE